MEPCLLPTCSLELLCLTMCLSVQHGEVRSGTPEVLSHLYQHPREPAALLLYYIPGLGVF